MTEQKKSPQHSLPIGILGCVGGLLLQLIAGSLYQWGMVSIYITSYFKMTDSSLTLEQTSVSTSLMMVALGLTISLGLFLCKKTHPLIVLLISQVLQAVTIFASSYMTNFWLFVFFYGIIFGLVAGAAFMIPIVQCNKYLVGKKMYVNGFILVGTGLGSVVFGQFSYNFLNGNNVAPLNGYYVGSPELEDIALKVPTLMKWLSLMYLGIGLLGTSLVAPVIIRNRKAQNQHEKKRIEKQLAHEAKKQHVDFKIQGHQNYQNNQNQQNHQNKQKQKNHLTRHQRKHSHEAHTISEAVRSKIFWISNLMFLFASAGVLLVTSNYKTFVKTTIKDDQFLTLVGVIGGIGNGCSRFLWNLLFAKTGLKTVLLSVLTLSMIVFATIRFTVQIKEAYLIEIFILNCCLGGFLVATPTGLQSLYGHSTGSQIYGIYWETFSIANLIAWIYVSQLAHVIGFNNVIYICLFMVALAYPVVIFLKFKGPWDNDTTQLQFCVGRQIVKRQEEKISQPKKVEQFSISDDIAVSNQVNQTIDDKIDKASVSTASHIPSFGDVRFSKKFISEKNEKNEKKDKSQEKKVDLTSLRIINEAESPKSGEKDEQKYAQLPNIQSTNVIMDEKRS